MNNQVKPPFGFGIAGAAGVEVTTAENNKRISDPDKKVGK